MRVFGAREADRFISEGCTIASGLIPMDVVHAARRALLDVMAARDGDPGSWRDKAALPQEPANFRLTEACRTEAIDGMTGVTTWPAKRSLVLFAYLNDVPDYGGATAILPGSHRPLFEHWVATSHPGTAVLPKLPYADARPLPGEAGDVIFMHYLLVHSGSQIRSATIRVGMNTYATPDCRRPYRPKRGEPGRDWTPLDVTLRTDHLDL